MCCCCRSKHRLHGCAAAADLSIDAMDVSGEQQIDVDHNVYKERLSSAGEVIPDQAPEKESAFDSFALPHPTLRAFLILVIGGI